MPKSVDGDIRLTVEIDASAVDKGTQNINKSVSRVNNSFKRFGSEMQRAFTGGEQAAEQYNRKMAKAEEAVRKQEAVVQNLRDKFDALKNGDAAPASLKKMDADIAKALKSFDGLIAKMDAAKARVTELEHKAQGNPTGRSAAALRAAREEYAALADEVAKAGGKLDAMQAQAEKLRLNPEATTEGKKLAREIEMANAKLDRLKLEASYAAEGFDKTANAVQNTNKQIEKTPKAVTKSEKYLKRFKRILLSAFVFNVISRGFTALQQQASKLLRSNNQFSNSLAKIKGNLITAFTPIYQYILPAVNKLMDITAKATAYIAAFISALTGKTTKDTAKAAEELYNQATATDKLTQATDNAAKSLADFDEINKIGSANKSDNTATAPDFSGLDNLTGAEAAAQKLSPFFEALAEFAGDIADAFKEDIAPRLKDFGSALLDFLPDLGNLDKDDIKAILKIIAEGIGAIVLIKIGASAIQGISNLKNALTTFLSAVGAHPILATATALSSLYLAMIAYDNFKFNTSNTGKLVSFFDEVAASAEKACDKSKAFREEAEEKYKNIDTNFMSLITIADRYYALSQKAQLTDEDKHMLKYYYDYLDAHDVDLTGKIDDVTKAYTGTREELEQLIITQIKYAYIQAAQEQLAEAFKQQIALQQEINETTKALELAKTEQSKAYNGYQKTLTDFGLTTFFGFTGDDINSNKFAQILSRLTPGESDARRNYNELTNSVEELSDKLTDLNTEYSNTSEDIYYCTSLISSSGESIDTYIQNLLDYTRGLTDTGLGMDAAKRSAGILGDTVDQTTKKLAEFNSKLAETEGKTVDPNFAPLDSSLNVAIRHTQNVNANLDTTASKTVDPNFTSLRSNLASTDTQTQTLNSALDRTGGAVIDPDFTSLNSNLDVATAKAIALQNALASLGVSSKAPNVNVGYSRFLPIPKLATGAVIPANREFLAVLGDQRHGTNVEAPLATIEQAVANVIARTGVGGRTEAILEIDGEKFGRMVYKLNKRESKRVGVNFSEV